ncbi:HAMP domain-containing histidine kinase [Adhaeribacter sp. BT258]|uniref:histidine kinase n=1 Tax=Adhaeribacter terrigena TaxID=2793070 RepID=A0ABS1C5L0_9BACT|nr:HAMP domain-containing sensor histidine kinase [Adhaeribacter terrigena]MBK0403835.1 HAMP domain-containing histidine kinase [Adhaeribacter terrigena]
MTFRSRLTLAFSLLIAAVLIAVCTFVYFQAKDFTHRQFFQRLYERGLITGQLFLERDELSAKSMDKVRQKYLNKLNEEVLTVYNSDLQPRFLLDSSNAGAPTQLLEQIRKDKYVEFWEGDRQVVGFFYHDNEGNFFIIASAKDATGLEKLANLKNAMIFSVLGSLLLVLTLGYFLSQQVLRPIREIVSEVNKIRASNLHLRVKGRSSKDEIAELTQTFNQMLERLELSFEMQKSFIANASHELRNPLTAISGEIEVALLKDRSVPEYKTSLQTLQNETNRLQKLTSDLITLAQTGFDEQEIQRESVRLDELLLEVKQELESPQTGNSRIRLHLENLPDFPEKLTVPGNRNLLKIALQNILENALKFSDQAPVAVTFSYQNSGISITVKDSGIGIPAEEISYVFQPFYRAQNARSRQGTGIGLSLTDKIMKLHHGQITIESHQHKGTTVTVKFKS